MNININEILEDPVNFAESISISKLVNILRELSDAYYNSPKPLISDDIFDILRDVLEERDPNNKFLKEIGSPVSKDKVKLPYPMASLDKIKPNTNELDKWLVKYKGPYVISDKLDGISAQLYKDNTGKFKLYTRGNGYEGQDISHLIPYVLNKRSKINDIPNGTSIRGELIIPKKKFREISDYMANARNAVSGLVNSKVIDRRVAKITKLIVYSIIHPRVIKSTQMNMLKEWKMDTVKFQKKNEINDEELERYLIERREKSPYEIDGIVVEDSSRKYNLIDGNPKHAFAFKAISRDQYTKARVVDVIWNASKDGLLKPRVEIEPIKLSGTTIRYATAFNAKYVKDNRLGPGAIIQIIRSGDVIPHIMEVIRPAKRAKLPNTKYKWTDSKVDIYVDSNNKTELGNQIKVRRLVHFFRTLDIKYISEGIITNLVNNGYDSIEKILSADENDLCNIEGIGIKLVNKIFNNIDNVLKNTDLATFMAASNIFGSGMGVKRLKEITKIYPNIMTVRWNKETMVNNINDIDGFSNINTLKFVENFCEFKTFFNKINKIIDIEYLKRPKNNDNMKKTSKFKDQVIVFTGFRNKDWEKAIENGGGKVSNNVSRNTTILVYSDDIKTSGKIDKANKLNIEIMSEREFSKKYKI